MQDLATQVHGLLKQSGKEVAFMQLRGHVIAALERTGDADIVSSEFVCDLVLSPDGAVVVLAIFLYDGVGGFERFTINLDPSESRAAATLHKIGAQNGFRVWVFKGASLVSAPYFFDQLTGDVVANLFANARLHNADRKVNFSAACAAIDAKK